LGLVHCDVSPSNIFVGNDGQVRLGDFGIAHSKLVTTALTETGIAGKASYLSPEQIEEGRLSPGTDVFALGAVLFEMLCGRRAFIGKNTREVLKQICAGDAPRVRSIRDDPGRDGHDARRAQIGEIISELQVITGAVERERAVHDRSVPLQESGRVGRRPRRRAHIGARDIAGLKLPGREQSTSAEIRTGPCGK
jgi:serine/threonine protein kinase